MSILSGVGALLASILSILGLGAPPVQPPGLPVDLEGVIQISLAEDFLAELQAQKIKLSGSGVTPEGLACAALAKVNPAFTEGKVSLGCGFTLTDPSGEKLSISDFVADLTSLSVQATIDGTEQTMSCFTFNQAGAAMDGKFALPDQQLYLTPECANVYNDSFGASVHRKWSADEPIAEIHSEFV